MRILTKTRKFFNALRRLFSKWTAKDCCKAGVDTRYSAEIETSSDESLLQDAFISVLADERDECESKLLAATEALRRIECLTNEKAVMFMPEIGKIHGIALDAYRKTQK